MATNRPWSDSSRSTRAQSRDVSRYVDRSTGTRITARSLVSGARWTHRTTEGTSIHVVLTGSASENAPGGTVVLPRSSLAVRPSGASAAPRRTSHASSARRTASRCAAGSRRAEWMRGRSGCQRATTRSGRSPPSLASAIRRTSHARFGELRACPCESSETRPPVNPVLK